MPRKNCPGPDMKITEKAACSPTKQIPCDRYTVRFDQSAKKQAVILYSCNAFLVKLILKPPKYLVRNEIFPWPNCLLTDYVLVKREKNTIIPQSYEA